ncbi:MAG: PEP-CTERM sorting domain-containing protein [Thermoguttaceae bacterium]
MLYECPKCNGFVDVGDMVLLGKKVTCSTCKCAVSALEARQLAEQWRLGVRQLAGKPRKLRPIVFFAVLTVVVWLTDGVVEATSVPSLRVLWSTIVGTSDGNKPAPKPPQVTPEPAARRAEETCEPTTSPQEVPEPSTLALLSVGALGLAAYAWRKRLASAKV